MGTPDSTRVTRGGRIAFRRVGSLLNRSLGPAGALLLALVATGTAAQGDSPRSPGAVPLREAPRAAGAARASRARPSLPYNGTIRGVSGPFAVAFDHYSRKIYVTERGRDRVAIFDRLGRRRGSLGKGELEGPTALAFDLSGNLAVLSARSREVALFRPGGRLLAKVPVPAVSPLGIAYEPVSRRLLVTDALTDSVWISRDGRNWRQERPPGLTGPVGVDAARGRFYVVSSADARVMELSSSGRLIRAVALRGARQPYGITFRPFGDGLVASSAGNHSGLFATRLGGALTRFGGPRRMEAPVLPGSECTRVAFPDFPRNRVVAFDLPSGAQCAQGLALRRAVTGRGFSRILATVVAENDGRVSVTGSVSVAARGRPSRRYRLRGSKASLRAASPRKLRIQVPGAAARGIRRALRARRTSTVRLTFSVRNAAGVRRRVRGRLLYRPRALAAAAGRSRRGRR